MNRKNKIYTIFFSLVLLLTLVGVVAHRAEAKLVNDDGKLALNDKAIRDLEKRDDGSTDFWFATIDSIENKCTGFWFNRTTGATPRGAYHCEETIAGINSHPEVEFIITTGDNVVNPETFVDAQKQYTTIWRAGNKYFDAPIIYVAGNHDIGSYGRWGPMKAWENMFGPLDFEFDYKGVHFVGVGNGNTQTTPMQEADPGRFEEVCEMIGNADNTLVFKHLVYVGNTIYPYQENTWDCEAEHAQAVFFGHYGTNQERTYNGIPYYETGDANEGKYRLVHVVDGEVVETIAYGDIEEE